MNITHATDEQVTGDKLKAIFDRQRELMSKYHHIEVKSGLCQTEDLPVNLDDKRGQARIKDFAWRIVEELGEALDGREDENHLKEELVDGLHFLTELTILVGKDYDNIIRSEPVIYEGYLEFILKLNIYSHLFILEMRVSNFIQELGMLCNCLKNKPWKQTHMKTDKEAFFHRLEKVWISYLSILNNVGMTPEDIVNTYLKKSQVNGFRIRSQY